MLAEYLSDHPEIAEEVEAHAAAAERLEAAKQARRERLRGLLAELVETLQHADGDEPARNAHGSELRDRRLVRNDILATLEKNHVDLSVRELMVLADWVWATEWNRLYRAHAQKSALLDVYPDAAALTSPDGRIAYINRAAAQLLKGVTGVPADQVVGKVPRELGFRTEAGPSPAEFLELASSNGVAEVLVMGRWKEIRASPIYAPNGAVEQLGITLTDVHDHKISQIRLEVLSRLSNLVGSADRNSLWKSLAQVPIPQLADWCAVNLIEGDKIARTFIAQRDPAKAWLRDALVRSSEKLTHHPLWRELLATGFQLLTEVSDDLLRTIALDEERYRLLAQVGIRSLMVVPVASRGKPIAIVTFAHTNESGLRYGHDDPALGVELAVHAANIAENVRLLEATKTSEDRFRVALAGAHTIVYGQDRELRYVWHYAPDLPYSLVGMTDADALPADEAAALKRVKQRVLDTGEPVDAEMELSFGGVRRWYRQHIEVVLDRLGQPSGVIGAATDVTDEKRTQQQLNTALTLRDEIMGVLGHDLRNPLAALTMAARALTQRNDLPPGVRATVDVIDRTAERMTELIATLLDFTRMRTSEQPLPILRVPCDLTEVARRIVEESRTASPDRVIQLETTGTTSTACDAARIAQALSNLVTNALVYGDPTRPVRVRIDGRSDALTVEVHNEGAPIPASLLPTIFDPFTRGQTAPGRSQGLGLGLFVVREIVKAHGGTVDLTSSAEAGTTFTMRFPRDR